VPHSTRSTTAAETAAAASIKIGFPAYRRSGEWEDFLLRQQLAQDS
jgi:hypothetical protein